MATAALVTPEELLAHEITVFQSTPGLAFAAAREHRIRMEYQGQAFYVISREDLISSTRAGGRAVDLEDVRALEEGAK